LNTITWEDVIDWINSPVDIRTSTRKEAEQHIIFFDRAMGYGMSAARLPEVGYRGAFGHSLGDVQGLHHYERRSMLLNRNGKWSSPRLAMALR